jgi:lysophospholipase L1-like esterase
MATLKRTISILSSGNSLKLNIGLISLLLLIAAINIGTAPIKIMPLGDSITQGVNKKSCYRFYLDSLLLSAGYSFDMVGSLSGPESGYDSNHEGHWGWEAHALLPNIGNWARSAQPDVVLMHAGTNDILHETDANRMIVVNRTIGELGSIIDTLRAVNPSIKIFLAQIIPDISASDRVDIDSLNKRIPQLASSKNAISSPIIVVDQNTGFNFASDLADSYHPNETGARKMAAKWCTALIDRTTNVISITSPPSVSVPISGKFGYKVKYLNSTNIPTVTINWLKKPTWITTLGDSAFSTTVAPSTPGMDSMKVVVSAGTSSDTQVVAINIAYYNLFEAESGALAAPMAIVADPSASGSSCISASTGVNTITKKIESSYTVTNMPAGNYYVWLKMSIPTGATATNFGIFVGFGSTLNSNFLKPKTENVYTWVRSTVNIPVTAGTNTFILGHGLALAKIDQIVITTCGDSILPAGLKVTSIQEKQIKNRKTNLNGTSIIPRNLSGGRINFVMNGVEKGDFALDVFNIAGSRVWSYHKESTAAPEYQFIWDGADTQLKPVRSGVYVAKIKTESFSKQLLVLLNR